MDRTAWHSLAVAFLEIGGQQLESSSPAPRPSPDLFSALIWVVQILFDYEGQLFPESASAEVCHAGVPEVGRHEAMEEPWETVLWVFLGWGHTEV